MDSTYIGYLVSIVQVVVYEGEVIAIVIDFRGIWDVYNSKLVCTKVYKKKWYTLR